MISAFKILLMILFQKKQLMNNKVSIITINYNGIYDTTEFINSLRDHEIYPYELIVIDNASKNPEESSILRKMYPDILVIRSDKNLGFAGGNNLGINYATGNYIFFLNNDIIITTPILEELVNRLEKDKKIGCVSPKIANWPQKETIQFAGFTPMTTITLRNECIGYKQKDKGQFNLAHKTPFAHGAAMMVRSEDIQKFGLMPEFYFLYYEEFDWCVHMRNIGYTIWYEPRSTVYHKESVSIGLQSPLQVYYHTRNRYIFAKRTVSNRFIRICCYLYQIVIVFNSRILKYILEKKFHLLSPLFKGTRDGLLFNFRNN